jgi:phosphohistidine phosphatase SixA
LSRVLIITCWILIALSTCDLATAATIYLVRHAEKESGEDPDLSAAGHLRAAHYADYFRDLGVSRVFSSNFRRTRNTAAPLLELIGAQIEIYNHRIDDLDIDFCESADAILIVGHSNTIPQLTALLSETEVPPMDYSEYNVGYKVTCGRRVDSRVEALDLSLPPAP